MGIGIQICLTGGIRRAAAAEENADRKERKKYEREGFDRAVPSAG